MSRPRKRTFGGLIGGLVLLLALLHQDFWNWDDGRLLFGFLPVGLAYHAGFSLVAASFWAFAVVSFWPDHLEEWAEGGETHDPSGGEGA